MPMSIPGGTTSLSPVYFLFNHHGSRTHTAASLSPLLSRTAKYNAINTPSVQSKSLVGVPKCCIMKYHSHDVSGPVSARPGARMTNSCLISSSNIRTPRLGVLTRYSLGFKSQLASLCQLNHGPQVGSSGNHSRFSSVARATHSAIFVILCMARQIRECVVEAGGTVELRTRIVLPRPQVVNVLDTSVPCAYNERARDGFCAI